MSTSLALLFALALRGDSLSDAQTHLAHGNHYYVTGSLSKAYAEYRVAIQILDHAPCAELATALNNLGSTLVSLHEYERALPVLRRATEVARHFLTPENLSQVQANTAQAMVRLGLHAAARPLLAEALEHADPSSLPGLWLIRAAICLEEADQACAHRDLNQVLETVPTGSLLSATAHALRASAWQKLKQHDRAVAEFEIAIEIANRTPGWETTAEAQDLLESFNVSLLQTGRRRQAKALQQRLKRKKRIDPTP